jgi:hypothetical protein
MEMLQLLNLRKLTTNTRGTQRQGHFAQFESLALTAFGAMIDRTRKTMEAPKARHFNYGQRHVGPSGLGSFR